VEVLAELLSMKDVNNCPCFDVNQLNHRGGTNMLIALWVRQFCHIMDGTVLQYIGEICSEF
jgi:hypothetical protein